VRTYPKVFGYTPKQQLILILRRNQPTAKPNTNWLVERGSKVGGPREREVKGAYRPKLK